MGFRLFIPAAIVVFVSSGCGFPQAKLDEAKAIVEKGLAAWKEGKKPDSLAPVDFHDDYWAQGFALASSEVKTTYYDDASQMVRCEVNLTLRPPVLRGKQQPEQSAVVVYDVKLGPPAKVSTQAMP